MEGQNGMEQNTAPFAKKTVTILTAIFIAALSGFYFYWLFTVSGRSAVALLLSAAAFVLFTLIGAGAIRDVFRSWDGTPEISLAAGLGKRSLRAGHRHPLIRLFLALLLVRLAVYIVAYMLFTMQKGYQGPLFDTLSTIWLKGDAPHYLGIADNWYVTEGDPRFHIVFFPLYPILVRIVNLLFNNTFASGIILSVLFTVAAGVLLYELALLDLDRAAAKRAVAFQMLLPAMFLLNAPMSDGLFLLLSIATVLLARKNKYVLACLVGGLAAFTRVLGIVLLVPIFVELIGDARRIKAAGSSAVMFLLPRILALVLIPMGLIGYLVINYDVTGDAFTFLTYQREHWYQQPGWFFNTVAYQTDQFFNKITTDSMSALALWLPNVLSLFASLALMLGVQRRAKPAPSRKEMQELYDLLGDELDWVDEEAEQHVDAGEEAAKENRSILLMRASIVQPYRLRASYMAYFLAYFLVGMGATWLLSAPRHLVCCFPLSIALASIAKSRKTTFLLYTILLVCQILYMAAYVGGGPVY